MVKKIKIKINQVLMQFPFLLWVKLKVKFVCKLKKVLEKQLRPINASYLSRPAEKLKRILLPQIETSHYQYYQMFILAKALQLRGAEVKILLCGSRLDGCEIKSVKNIKFMDPCIYCRFNHKHIVSMYGIDILRLSELISQTKVKYFSEIAASIVENYPSNFSFNDINIIPMVDESVIRHYYGFVPSGGEDLKEVRKKHLVSSMIGIEAARNIDKVFSPDVVLNNMFAYSVTEPYHKYFGKKGHTELFSVSITPYNYYSVVLNIMELYKSPDRYLQYLEGRGNKRLTCEEKLELQDFVGMRLRGESDVFREYDCFASKSNIDKILGIDATKRNVFLFSSVFWDVGMSDSGRLFHDVINWVLQTIEILKNQDYIHLYIKPHPAEKYDSSASLKGVADYIYDKYPVLPNNVTLILPEMKIKPYELFPYIDLGVVYNGTLGLEMLLYDVQIVITGKAPYGGLGFAHEPLTLEEYRKILLGEINPIIPDKGEVELFAYFYFIKTQIPWTLTKRAYADDFKGYTFDSLEDILPGKNKYLDHICDCILKDKPLECW